MVADSVLPLLGDQLTYDLEHCITYYLLLQQLLINLNLTSIDEKSFN